MDEQEYLANIVTPIVNNPEDVKINRTQDEMGVLLTLTVNPADVGIVIGKGGEVARTIRTLLRLYGYHRKAKISMKISEPTGPRFHSDDQENF